MKARSLTLAIILASAMWLGFPAAAATAAGVHTEPALMLTLTTASHPCSEMRDQIVVRTTCHGVVTVHADSITTTPSNSIVGRLSGFAQAYGPYYVNWWIRWTENDCCGNWIYTVYMSGESGYNGSSAWNVNENPTCSAQNAVGWYCDWNVSCPATCHGNYWS